MRVCERYSTLYILLFGYAVLVDSQPTSAPGCRWTGCEFFSTCTANEKLVSTSPGTCWIGSLSQCCLKTATPTAKPTAPTTAKPTIKPTTAAPTYLPTQMPGCRWTAKCSGFSSWDCTSTEYQFSKSSVGCPYDPIFTQTRSQCCLITASPTLRPTTAKPTTAPKRMGEVCTAGDTCETGFKCTGTCTVFAALEQCDIFSCRFGACCPVDYECRSESLLSASYCKRRVLSIGETCGSVVDGKVDLRNLEIRSGAVCSIDIFNTSRLLVATQQEAVCMKSVTDSRNVSVTTTTGCGLGYNCYTGQDQEMETGYCEQSAKLTEPLGNQRIIESTTSSRVPLCPSGYMNVEDRGCVKIAGCKSDRDCGYALTCNTTSTQCVFGRRNSKQRGEICSSHDECAGPESLCALNDKFAPVCFSDSDTLPDGASCEPINDICQGKCDEGTKQCNGAGVFCRKHAECPTTNEGFESFCGSNSICRVYKQEGEQCDSSAGDVCAAGLTCPTGVLGGYCTRTSETVGSYVALFDMFNKSWPTKVAIIYSAAVKLMNNGDLNLAKQLAVDSHLKFGVYTTLSDDELKAIMSASNDVYFQSYYSGRYAKEFYLSPDLALILIGPTEFFMAKLHVYMAANDASTQRTRGITEGGVIMDQTVYEASLFRIAASQPISYLYAIDDSIVLSGGSWLGIGAATHNPDMTSAVALAKISIQFRESYKLLVDLIVHLAPHYMRIGKDITISSWGFSIEKIGMIPSIYQKYFHENFRNIDAYATTAPKTHRCLEFSHIPFLDMESLDNNGVSLDVRNVLGSCSDAKSVRRYMNTYVRAFKNKHFELYQALYLVDMSKAIDDYALKKRISSSEMNGLIEAVGVSYNVNGISFAYGPGIKINVPYKEITAFEWFGYAIDAIGILIMIATGLGALGVFKVMGRFFAGAAKMLLKGVAKIARMSGYVLRSKNTVGNGNKVLKGIQAFQKQKALGPKEFGSVVAKSFATKETAEKGQMMFDMIDMGNNLAAGNFAGFLFAGMAKGAGLKKVLALSQLVAHYGNTLQVYNFASSLKAEFEHLAEVENVGKYNSPSQSINMHTITPKLMNYSTLLDAQLSSIDIEIPDTRFGGEAWLDASLDRLKNGYPECNDDLTCMFKNIRWDAEHPSATEKVYHQKVRDSVTSICPRGYFSDCSASAANAGCDAGYYAPGVYRGTGDKWSFNGQDFLRHCVNAAVDRHYLCCPVLPEMTEKMTSFVKDFGNSRSKIESCVMSGTCAVPFIQIMAGGMIMTAPLGSSERFFTHVSRGSHAETNNFNGDTTVYGTSNSTLNDRTLTAELYAVIAASGNRIRTKRDLLASRAVFVPRLLDASGNLLQGQTLGSNLVHMVFEEQSDSNTVLFTNPGKSFVDGVEVSTTLFDPCSSDEVCVSTGDQKYAGHCQKLHPYINPNDAVCAGQYGKTFYCSNIFVLNERNTYETSRRLSRCVRQSCIPGVRECPRAGDTCQGYAYGVRSGECVKGSPNPVVDMSLGKDTFSKGILDFFWLGKPGMVDVPPRPANTDDDNYLTKCAGWIAKYGVNEDFSMINICKSYVEENYFLPPEKK